MGFFEPRFYSTSHASPAPHRLNARYAAIIEANADKLAGSRVLDIASHDARWSFAALRARASHIVGIEPRTELVDNARRTLAEYGIDPAHFEFMQGSVFDLLGREGMRFDVVLCLGFSITRSGMRNCWTWWRGPAPSSW